MKRIPSRLFSAFLLILLPIGLFNGCSNTQNGKNKNVPVPSTDTDLPKTDLVVEHNSSKDPKQKQESNEARSKNGSFQRNVSNYLIQVAKKLIEAMRAGKFDMVHETFDRQLRKDLSKSKLKSTWNKITRRIGPFKNIVDTSFEQSSNQYTVLLQSKFQKDSVTFKVIFDSKHNVYGFYLYPDKKLGND